MAISSMTGYGRGVAAADGIKVEVELSSVNRRQLDVRVSLPRSLAALEALVYDAIHAKVSRGSVNGTVDIRVGRGGVAAPVVDEAAAEACVRRLRAVAARLGLKDDLSAGTLALLPGVVRPSSAGEDTQKLWPLIGAALQKALGQMLEMRRTEGASLQKDMVGRFGKLKRILERIRKRAPLIPREYRRRLERRLQEAGFHVRAVDEQLVRELAIFADRCDISEEIVRLESHFKQVADLLAGSKPVGRTLDFLCQEMLREVNTIGSKGNDVHVARQVIVFKTELESVREQVQNVE